MIIGSILRNYLYRFAGIYRCPACLELVTSHSGACECYCSFYEFTWPDLLSAGYRKYYQVIGSHYVLPIHIPHHRFNNFPVVLQAYVRAAYLHVHSYGYSKA